MRKGWFGPRTIGWGISPRSWEGWVVTAAFIAGLAACMRWLRPVLEDDAGWPPAASSFALIGGWLVLFLAVIWLTYDRDAAR